MLSTKVVTAAVLSGSLVGCAQRTEVSEAVVNPNGNFTITLPSDSPFATQIAPKKIIVDGIVYLRARDGDNLREKLEELSGWKIPEGSRIEAFGGVYWKSADQSQNK